MIIRLVKMVFRHEEAENFEALFNSRKTLIAGSPGCQSVELLKDVQTSDNVRIYFTRSIWKDEQSLENYRASELFADTWKLTKEKFAGKPEAWTTKIVSS